ncbi:hypothetical protein C7212DRAFT_343711 [Tuber magnatum]|uniref:BTB domain-containing protein n=1 Tax=Tuber magnatum TaxID=42249 RepID=A0A317SRH6_9PEZI|nr:hypothetical protein C7212DRAFT_343711 [Tuber magnatum]
MERPQITGFLESEVIALEGADTVIVHVHKELLDAHCGASGDRWWSCFNSGTIKRLVEFLYQGDYTAPPPVPVLPVTPASTIYGGDSGSGAGDAVGESTLLAAESTTSPGSLDYEGVLLSHAELFILAKSRQIDRLGNICLGKLLADMKEAQAKLPDSVFSEIMVELLQYSYSHCYMGNSSGWGELQEVISKVWIEKIEWILEMPGASLLSGEGKLVKDLMIGTVKRLIEANRRLATKEENKEQVVVLQQECIDSISEEVPLRKGRKGKRVEARKVSYQLPTYYDSRAEAFKATAGVSLKD